MAFKTIRFNQFDSGGGILNFIDVTGVVIYGTDFYKRPVNQFLIHTVDGGTVPYGNNVKRVPVMLNINAVLKANGDAFRDFITDNLDFQFFQVGIELFGAPINLGKGDGIDIEFGDKARYSMKDTKTLTKLMAPGIHNIRFNFEYRGT